MNAIIKDRIASLILQLGAMGNVHTTTCRAFSASEMDEIAADCVPNESFRQITA